MGEGISPVQWKKDPGEVRRTMSHSAWRIAAVMIVPALASTAVLDRLATDTPVRVRLMQRLSSAESHVNDRVEFEVSEDVKIGNFTVITAGSSAWGAVVEASPRSRLLRSGRLAVDIRGVCLANGQRAPLRGTPSTAAPAAAHPSEEGPSTNLLALPALPVMLFLYGKDITIPAGHFATAYVSPGVNFDPASLVEAPNTFVQPGSGPARAHGCALRCDYPVDADGCRTDRRRPLHWKRAFHGASRRGRSLD